MITCDRFRLWFTSNPERLVIFTLGLLFCKGMMTYVLENFITFLTDTWELKLREAAAVVNIEEGLRNMLQIFAVFCIDACLGYRRMLILSSVLYCAGLVLLAFSVPEYYSFDEEYCTGAKFRCLNSTPFWEGLALLIAGGAAQVIPLYSLSFDQTKIVKVPENCKATRVKDGCSPFKVKIGGWWRQLQQRFIRWLCIAFVLLGSIISLSGFIFLQLEWHQRFLISAIAIAIGLIWFFCGFSFYGSRRLQPCPVWNTLRVLIAAVRKSRLIYQEGLHQLHRCAGDDQSQPLTDHLKFLNNAAVKESAAGYNSIMEDTWKLCTVKEVEQTKLLLDIIPMSATFIVYGMVKSVGNTFFIEQAYRMRDGTGNRVVVFQIIQGFSGFLFKWGYKLVFEKRIERTQKQYSDGVKIGLGMLASIICCAVASFVESKRLKAVNLAIAPSPAIANAAATPPPSAVIARISAFWLVPQFVFLGAMEGLAGEGIQDFFGHHVPDSRRYGPVFTRSLTGFGTLLNIGFIAILEYYSKFKYHKCWLRDNVNESHLDSVYRAYVMVALLNFFLYAHVAYWFSYNNITGRPEEEEEEIPFLEVLEQPAPDQQNNQEQQNNQGLESIL